MAPTFKPFTLALVQLGGIGSDKNGLWSFTWSHQISVSAFPGPSANLKHAREMVLKAASGKGPSGKKPDLIVLPVRVIEIVPCSDRDIAGRNASTRHMAMCISRCTQRPSRIHRVNLTIPKNLRVNQ